MEIQIGKQYKHYKRGHVYTVLNIARDCDTLEEVVIYQGEYDDPEFGKRPIWTRPLKDFCSEVEVQGKTVSRFTEIT